MKPAVGGARWLIAVLLGLTLVQGVTWAWLEHARLTAVQAPVLGRVPDFQLSDQLGRPVSLGSLRSKVWVANFIFTRCGSICPMMSARMRRLAAEVDPAVRLVSITVDPAYDTQEVLKAYAEGYGASPERWSFLTGPAEPIYDLARRGFKLAAEPGPEGEGEGEGAGGAIVHSSRFVLVDQAGRIRGFFDSADAEAMRSLVQAIGQLLDRPVEPA